MKNITIEEIEKMAKEQGVEINYIDALNRAIVEKYEKQMPMSCEAVFRLNRDNYPEMKRTTIIVTDNGGDEVIVAVKVIGRVFKALEDGAFEVKEANFGDMCSINKNEPIGKLFEGLKNAYENTAKLIKETNKDVKA